MKLGIITLVSDNYGNKYQNYAVEQLLSEYGEVVTYQVESKNQITLQQRKSFIQKLTHVKIAKSIAARLMNRYDLKNAQRSALGNLAYFLCNKKKIIETREFRHRNFLNYQQQYLHISDRVITAENCREEPWNQSHDYFVCGSDQIWNPNYSTTTELAFLSFAKGKRIALAPSFGISAIPEDRKENFRNWINGITHLSVREDAGRQIIKDLTGKDAEVLLDPTMAIDPSCWADLAKAPKKKLPENYILTYFLGRVSHKYYNRICQISKETGLPVINLFNVEEPEYYTYDPNEVLYAIQNASLVLTDSFHGSVFSILFHKDFWVFSRDEDGMSMHSRLTTLLQKFGLTDRLINDTSALTPVPQTTWEHISYVLAQEQEKTKVYLKNAIAGDIPRKIIKTKEPKL